MNRHGGYLLIFNEENHSRTLQNRVEEDDRFTDVISAPDWQPEELELALISFDNESISHAALAVRKRMVATAKFQVEFSDFKKWQPPINFAEIEAQIGTDFRKYLTLSSNGRGKNVPSEIWSQLLNVIRRLRPDTDRIFEFLKSILENQRMQLFEEEHAILAQEKDALGLALSIFGYDRQKVLPYWTPPNKGFNQEIQSPDQGSNSPPGTNDTAPFILGLNGQTVPILEENMIRHDMSVFGDWDRVKQYMIGAVKFEKGQEKLTVVYANQHAIEKTLGIDLVYYNHNYHTFVLVQYKRMIREDYAELGYAPDKQCEDEVQRMLQFESFYPPNLNSRSLYEYRLHPSTFYFKLCEAECLTPNSSDLIKGMYLPLELWKKTIESPNVRGPKGGTRLTRGNVDRYMNNTLFIELVQSGWIGSTTANSNALMDIIEESIRTGKKVVFANQQLIN